MSQYDQWTTTCPGCGTKDQLYVIELKLTATGETIKPIADGRIGTKLEPSGFFTGDQTLHMCDASSDEQRIQCDNCRRVFLLDDLTLAKPTNEIPTHELAETICDLAREAGAEYPTFADSTDDEPVVVDTASGRTWKITLQEF